MSTIKDLFQQALLAEAAYANFFSNSGVLLTSNADVIAALQNTIAGGKFSQAQAAAFAARYQVVSQIPDTASGFSATLFLDTTTNQYTFAARGTLGVADLLADAGDILMDGVALDQIVDLYNYWQSLTHTGTYQAKQLNTLTLETAALRAAYAVSTIAGLAYEATLRANNSNIIIDNPTHAVRSLQSVNSTQLSDVSLQSGSGVLSSAAVVNVDGHSLGGHLAMAFSRLFPSATNSVVAVNGAGFGLGNSNVNNLFAALGGASVFDASKITNVVGSAAMNLVSQDWLFLQQPAGRSAIYTESYLPGSGTTLGHGAGQMTDSLAVYNLFATLDPTLNDASASNIDKISSILKASSNVAANSLESAIAALGKLFQVSTASGFTSNEFDVDRNKLYIATKDLTTAFNNFNVFILRDLSAFSGAQIASIAQNNLAYRYALLNLTPFALVGNDSVFTPHNTAGELDVYDPATGTGTLTQAWLTDRANMLAWKNQLATEDYVASAGNPYQNGPSDYYQDLKSGEEIYLGNPAMGNLDRRLIKFGDAQPNTLNGGAQDDRLYGMGGNDTLNGGSGNDYLEGGADETSGPGSNCFPTPSTNGYSCKFSLSHLRHNYRPRRYSQSSVANFFAI